MKRTLSLVLALVMILGTIPAFAAAPTVNEAADFLKEVGVLTGDLSGNLNLEAGLKRQDSAVLLSRLLGEADEAAKTEGEPTWEDIKDAFYNPVLTWALEGGFFKGHSAVRFGYDEVITAQNYSLVLLRALGYDLEGAEALDKAIELGLVAEDVDATAVINRGEMAVMTFIALGTEMADGEGTLAEALEIEMPTEEIEMTVEATGAKKLTVKFNQAVDTTKAVFEVTRGTVKPSVKSTTFAEDKMSAVIEFNLALAAGDYTVKVTGVEEEVLTSTVKVEAAKLTTIEFSNDVAVISNAPTATMVKVGVVAKNQYGENVTFTPNVSSSKGTGVLASEVLTLTSSTGAFVVNEKVVVTIVDSATGVVATQVLTVAQAAQVATITIGELKTDDSALAAKTVNVKNVNENLAKYYIPVEIKDQYGNTLKKADLVGVDILSSNKNIINPKGFKDLANVGTVIELDTVTPGPAVGGTVVITVVASGTGKTASEVVTVLANAKIDTATLSAPETELKLETAAVLPLTLVDTYGNEVALKGLSIVPNADNNELTIDTDTKLTVNGGTLAVKTNYTTNVTTIELTPTSKNLVITAVTATGKFASLTLTAVDAPVPASIKGMKSTFVSMLANDTTMKTSIAGNVVFLDQYGAEVSLTGTYTSTITPKVDPVYTTVAGDDIVAKVTAGTDVYVVKLLKDTTVLDEFEVSVTVVDKAKITSFGIDNLNKFYTGEASEAHDQQVEVHGLVNGNKVAIPQNMVKMVTATNGLPITSAGEFTASSVPTSDKDVDSTITVLVEAGANNYTLTKDVVYSSAAPVAKSLVINKGASEATGPVEITVTNDNLFTGIDGLKVVAKDQYNVDVKTGSFVVTNNDTTATFAIADNGDLTVTEGTPTVGKSFQINAFIDGLYKSVKVFVKQ